MNLTTSVLDDVLDERRRQDEKWGPVQPHPNIRSGWKNFNYGVPTAYEAKWITDYRTKLGQLTWTDILLEEVAEAFEEATKGDVKALREELIQVAAVAVKWVENLDAHPDVQLTGCKVAETTV